MNETHPFSIRIFVANGDPDGLRIIERSNWNGQAMVFPRPLLPEVKKREEFGRTGVYLLLGPQEDGEGELLYIGEGDPIRPRLESHFSNKDFWNRGVFFVTGQTGALNKAHVQYLEARLIELAHAAKRMVLDNQNKPNRPSLSEADQADMEVFLNHMLQILPLLGISAFEKPLHSKRLRNDLLFLSAKGLKAEGYESTSGFVVHKGSQAALEVAPSMQTYAQGAYSLRDKLIASGVLVKEDKCYRFTQDYSFSAPSTAAGVVMGRSANGRVDWKDKSGRTLKDIQGELAGEIKEPNE
ncbi:MAG: GIY-YIG nuclease family protein [Proteobacteria bacterium]|nr:GIY-YIG nuclease family protein [Pseudomonadota bacterium]